MKKYASLFFLTMFLIGTDTFLISPLLPTLSHIYHIPTAISGWLVSAYAIGYAVFALISGPISDGHDRKKVMLGGLLGFAIATLLCAFANSFPLMLVFRFLAGVSASFVTPQIWASIPVVIPRKQVVKVMGYATAGISVAQVIGIPIGSYLAASSWHTPFYVISGAALLLLLLLFFTLPELEIQSRQHLSFIQSYQQILTNRQAVSELVVYLIFQTGAFTVMTFVSTWFQTAFQLSLSTIGTALFVAGIGNLIGSLISDQLVQHFGLKKSFMSIALLLIIVDLLTITASKFWFAEIILILIYLLNGLILPLFMTMFQTTVPNAGSTISSLSNSAMYLGETFAGVIGGLLFKTFKNYLGIGLFAAMMIIVALTIRWILNVKTKR